MDVERFDALTRQSAGGVARRQVLKGLIGLTVGSLLSQIGWRSQANAYAQSNPAQGLDQPSFLPLIVKECAQASACGDRKPCGGFSNCICIRSSEGDIRCGKIPSTCYMPLCASSADCVHLGPGYFCDAPNSGCCTDPPASFSRCIPPCGPACPAEQVCGDVGCCGEGQLCVEGRCTSECPSARVCGDACCAEGDTCRDGQCVSADDCEIASITPTSMRAALAALAAGATSADLSPQGCIQVHQQRTGGEVVARSFTVGDKTLSSWSLANNQWTGRRDGDLDGFFEWRSVTTYGATLDDFETVETEYASATRQATRRTTITPQTDGVRIVGEERDEAGQWQVVEEYTTPSVQSVALAGDRVPPEEAVGAASPQATCEADPCDSEAIKQRMEEGVNLALQCLSNFGDRGVAIYEAAFNTLSRSMNVRCAAIPSDREAAIGGWANPRGRLEVIVDPAKYCALGDGQRAWLLFHEILHAALQRGHDPEVDKLPLEQRKQLDRVYGCIALCYTNQSQATQCMCAQCLGTITCDPICAAFNQDCGATCPCLAREGEYYTTCSQCLAECPSGLGCFGYSYCEPVGHSFLCPPVTCP